MNRDPFYQMAELITKERPDSLRVGTLVQAEPVRVALGKGTAEIRGRTSGVSVTAEDEGKTVLCWVSRNGVYLLCLLAEEGSE